MPDTILTRLKADTPTRIWVNNPTPEEACLALKEGVVGCTTNPAYGGGLLRRSPADVLPTILECVQASDDDAVVADLVQEALVARIAGLFAPLHEASHGAHGFVSIQGSPDDAHDEVRILAAARSGRLIAPNVIPKLPATFPGLDAFETLVADGCPVIMTEVFSLAQFIECNERYLRAAQRAVTPPPFFISPITGIFGDYLKAVAGESETATVDDMERAGAAVAQACHRIARERGYPSIILCGGARTDADLDEFVGMPVHLTVNWSTIAEVNARPSEDATWRGSSIDDGVVARLGAAFVDFRRAMQVDGLRPVEFEDFGPVQHFHSVFLEGWRAVRVAIAAERSKTRAIS